MIEDLKEALLNGSQITNGAQWIIFNARIRRGYLNCDEIGCCDMEFESLGEVLDYVKEHEDDWESIPTDHFGDVNKMISEA